MKYKTLLLTLLLTVGFTFNTCDLGGDDDEIICNCPEIDGIFFDIKGIDPVHLVQGSQRPEPAEEMDSLSFDQYAGLEIRFDVEYISQRCTPKKWNGFSLMNSALACSCLENGMNGSKTEMLEELYLITLNDFDDQHLANDTINDLFLVPFNSTLTTIEDFISRSSSDNIMQEFLSLALGKAPELDPNLKLKVVMGLTGGETYEAEVPQIYFE